MRPRLIALLAVAGLTGASAGASAQTIRASVYATFGTTQFAAHESLELVTGSGSKSGFGVGGSVTFWRSLFVDAAFSQQKLDGERVFIDGGTTYPLGIPLQITTRPIDIAGGWRILDGVVQPYAGGGVTVVSYKEESDFAKASENVSEQKVGGLFLAGVDVRVARIVKVGAEFRYRAVSGVLGEGGVSQLLGDDQLGGRSFAVRASVGR